MKVLLFLKYKFFDFIYIIKNRRNLVDYVDTDFYDIPLFYSDLEVKKNEIN